MQRTLKTDIAFCGIGLHSGRPVNMTVRPAGAGTGVVFRRVDVTDRDNVIFAHWSLADHSPLCTRLVNGEGVVVSTIEHLMAGLAGCGIHNAIVDVDAQEIPILDGSAWDYVQAFLCAGTIAQTAPVQAVRVLKPVEARHGDALARLEPSETLTIEFEIDFPEPAIGRQTKSLNMANGTFVYELCSSRTFCRRADVAKMHEMGLALGGTYENALVFDRGKLLSPGGLRHSDEPVRHKMLDALGDLSLAGGPILGRYIGKRAGHTLTNKLLATLFSTPDAFETAPCDAAMAARLPGADVTAADILRVPIAAE